MNTAENITPKNKYYVLDRDILEQVLETYAIASKDRTRYDLNAVLLRLKGTSAIVVATNGHALVETRFTIDATVEEGNAEIFFKDAEIKKLKVFLKETKKIDLIELEIAGNEVKFFCSFDSFAFKNCDGLNFPEYEPVVPKKISGENMLAITLNPELLMNLFKAMNPRSTSDMVTLMIDKTSPSFNPIAVLGGNESQKAVLMPGQVEKANLKSRIESFERGGK